MPTAITLRRATTADAGEILTIQRAAWVVEAQAHDTPFLPPLMQSLDDVRADLGSQYGLVAVDGHRMVGIVRAHAADGAWHIGRLGVVPDRQGERIGSRLLSAIEAAAPSDTARFALFTGPRSEHNVRFYEAHGYVRVSSDDGLIHLTKETAMTDTPPSLFTKIDHVGIAVADLDKAIAFYAETFGIVSVHEETNEEQGVREAMLAVGDGSTRIQLLAPLNEQSTIAKFLDRSGPGVQQVAYTVTDIEAVSETLRARGMRLLYDVPRRGTADSRVNFVHPKDAGGVLMELVQPADTPH